jgi:hypothetical protein
VEEILELNNITIGQLKPGKIITTPILEWSGDDEIKHEIEKNEKEKVEWNNVVHSGESQKMANWILMRFHSDLDEAQIKEIQVEYFDEVAMLESIFRQAKESGKVPTDFKALLQKQFGLDEPSKKKAVKALT